METKEREWTKDWSGNALALAIGVATFLLLFGARPLHPSAVDWLLSGDSANHLLGWLFFREESWKLPLGTLTRYPWPLGTNILQCDSIPIVAVVAKLLSRWLPHPFQYFGPWLFSCYLLLAWFSYRILSLLTPNLGLRLLATWLLTLSPVLLFRFGHFALCAQWVFLFHLLIAFELTLGVRPPARLPWVQLLLLNTFLTGVHPYLLLGSMVLTAFLFLRSFRSLPAERMRLILQFAAICGAVIAGGALFGYFTVSDPTATTFGYYPTDLFAFINSMGRSSLFPAIRFKGGVHEGFAYLGLGGFFLFGFLRYLKRQRPEDYARAALPWTYFHGVIALALFSLSPDIKFGGNTILKLNWLYLPLGPLPGIFRATGRFVWPLYYLIWFRLLARAFRLEKPRAAALLLLTVLALQWVDMGKWYLDKGWRVPARDWNVLKDTEWQHLADGTETLVMVPPFLPAEYSSCEPEHHFSTEVFFSAAMLAAEKHMRINSAFVSRLPSEKMEAYCSSVMTDWHLGRLSPHTLYIVKNELAAHLPAGACRPLDGVTACRLP